MTRGTTRAFLTLGLLGLVVGAALLAARPSSPPGPQGTWRPEEPRATADTTHYLSGTPMAVLEEYLTRDYRGDRLERANWVSYQPMVTWPSEPAWDRCYVVSSYRTYSGKVTLDKAKAEATFETEGRLDLTNFFYTPEPTRRTVAFDLQAVKGHWKISYPMVRPHVSVSAAIAYLERMRVYYTNRRGDIDASLKALRPLQSREAH